MNELEQLNLFYETIAEDERISVYHVCLYIALMRLRSAQGWQPFITIYRGEVMKQARVGRKTFNKCIGDLAVFGYLRYEPCTSPKGESKVYFNKL